jgi:hypothetical protein
VDIICTRQHAIELIRECETMAASIKGGFQSIRASARLEIANYDRVLEGTEQSSTTCGGCNCNMPFELEHDAASAV